MLLIAILITTAMLNQNRGQNFDHWPLNGLNAKEILKKLTQPIDSPIRIATFIGV